MGYFSRSFVKLRTFYGFPTVYKFYHANGGRRVFPCTYSHYIKIERGDRLPAAPELALMLKLLRGRISLTKRRGLMCDYLRDLSGSGAVFDELFAAMFAPTRDEPLPKQVGRQLHALLTTNVSMVQFHAIVSTPEATGAFMLFSNIPDPLSVERAAELIGSTEGKCAAALELLRRHGLVRARGKGGYVTTGAGRQYMLPNVRGSEALYKRMREHLDSLASRNGGNLYGHASVFRLSPRNLEAAIEGFVATFDNGAGLAESMIPLEHESPLYLFEARVRRLLPPRAR